MQNTPRKPDNAVLNVVTFFMFIGAIGVFCWLMASAWGRSVSGWGW